MGRRALRKIDPELDFSKWLLTRETLPDPWSAESLFGRVAPLEIEVGSGKGLFLENATRARPEHDFLGIEVAAKYARYCAARLARSGAPNGRAVHGDALALIRDLAPDASTHAVHVYFPDPWWKKRHHKRRVMNEGFVRDVERILVVGGRLHFWTDVRDYFDEALTTLAQHTRLVGPLPVPEPPSEHHLDFRTHFERRTRLAELPVHRAEYLREA